MAATPDHLFRLRNNFYLGTNQAAINTSDLPNLSQDDSVERLPCLSFLHCPWQLPGWKLCYLFGFYFLFFDLGFLFC